MTYTKSGNTITQQNSATAAVTNLENDSARPGEIRITFAANHNLQAGDAIQITGSTNYNGHYLVKTWIDGVQLTIIHSNEGQEAGAGVTITKGDKDYSTLAGHSGVTTTTSQGLKIYNIGDLRLDITGTQYHDPAKEIILSTYGGTAVNPATPISTVTGGIIYGIKTESNDNVRYSAMSGLYRTGDEGGGLHEWRGWETGLLYVPTGTIRMYGGLVQSSRGLQFGRDGENNADVIIEKTKFVQVGTSNRREIRFDSATGIDGSVDMIIDGFQVSVWGFAYRYRRHHQSPDRCICRYFWTRPNR